MTDEATLRRLRMRSMRRGIREMDLILSGYAEARLDRLGGEEIALYDALLSENDQDLYRWVSGREAAPTHYAALVNDIAQVTEARVKSRNL